MANELNMSFVWFETKYEGDQCWNLLRFVFFFLSEADRAVVTTADVQDFIGLCLSMYY